MITEDIKAAACPNCGGELVPLDTGGGAKPAIPPPGASGGMVPPKAPPAPPKAPPAPPKKPGG